MVPFLSNRQCTIAALVVLLILLVGLLPPLDPALAQSAVTLDPTSGLPGTEVTATGSGWSAGHEVKVRWDNTELTATTVDDNGGFTVSFTVPDDATEGQQTVYFVDAPPDGGLGYFIPANFTVTAPAETPPPEAEPTITLDPTEGPRGTEVTVQGSGWLPGETVSIHFVNPDHEVSVSQTMVVDDGSFETTFTVPADAAIGEQQVIAGNFETSRQTDALFHVTESTEEPTCPEPIVTLSASKLGDEFSLSGKPGDEFMGWGAGWLPGGTVTFTPIGPKTEPTEYEVTSVPVPDSGEWESDFIVPDTALPGDYDFVFSENHEGCELRVTFLFTVVAAEDTEPPTVSWVKPVGNDTVYPTASGTVELEVSATDNAGIELVELYRWDDVNQQWIEINIFSSPPYRASVEVNTLNLKWNRMFARVKDTAGNYAAESTYIYRLMPTITLDTTLGPADTQVTVQGSGWLPEDTVNINFADPANKVAQATVDNEGNFTAAFTIPTDAAIGEQKVIATTADGFWQTDTNFLVTAPPITSPRRQLIIFLQGILTNLSVAEANQGNIVGMDTVPEAVSDVFPEASNDPDASTRLLMYSYFKSRTDNGLPVTYSCADTVTNTIVGDIRKLDRQIENAFKVQPAGAEVDIYLIGHSLGGAVALAYLDFLQQGLEVSLPPNAHLKAVITLDSPLGGHRGFPRIIEDSIADRCPELGDDDPRRTPRNLREVYDSLDDTRAEPDETAPRGAQASFLVLHRGEPNWPGEFVPSNGDLTEAAQIDLGTSFLSIGNINDLFLTRCRVNPADAATQFLKDEGDGKGLYGREFVTRTSDCGDDIFEAQIRVERTHNAVLEDEDVQDAIVKFLNPIADGAVGGTPDPLRINRYQTNSP
jgi:hypothetical protein